MSVVRTQSVPGWQFGPCITSGCDNTSRWNSTEAYRRYSGIQPHYMCIPCCDAISHLVVRDAQMNDAYWKIANETDIFAMIRNADDTTEAIELEVTGAHGQFSIEHYHGGYLLAFWSPGRYARPSREVHLLETTLPETLAWVLTMAVDSYGIK